MQRDLLQDYSLRQNLLCVSFCLASPGLQVNQLALELRDGGLQRRFAGGTRAASQLRFSSNTSAEAVPCN